MRIVWASDAWADYLYWCRTDARVRQKIEALLEDIRRQPFKEA